MTDGDRPGAVALARLPDDGPLAPAAAAPHLLAAPIVRHVPVGAEYWQLTLAAPEVAGATNPGQFVMLTIARPGDPAPVLPRPMAIYARDPSAGTIDVVYRIVGEGTRRLTDWRSGEEMITVGPLGRGFVVAEGARRIVLIGRGIGTCSLTVLAADAVRAGVQVAAVASARHRGVLIGPDTYRAAGVSEVVGVVDEDGSSAPAALARRLAGWCADGVDELYVCGSARLLALAADLARRHGAGVQVSLEAHMACGLGFCHGCAAGRPGLPRETPLVCSDGPVFRHDPAAGAAA
jgi:dihydroorotate dehydrogenase electron transfer subunit